MLYNYLPELEAFETATNNDRTCDPSCLKHLDLLIGHIKRDYGDTTDRLVPLLENGEITYDLLWALFKPNTTVYTTCFGTRKPRCVIFDDGEEKTTKDNVQYYHMNCRYLDFDGSVFGEASIGVNIPKFRGTKRINSLQAFPLQYHQDENAVRAKLIECGRKFVSLMGTHHRHCQGEAFFMDDGKPIRFSVDSRIMIDAATFRKIDPNYSRPRIEPVKTSSDTSPWSELCGEPSSKSALGQVKNNDLEPTRMTEKDLIICCPTVLGFSLDKKIWGEYHLSDVLVAIKLIYVDY